MACSRPSSLTLLGLALPLLAATGCVSQVEHTPRTDLVVELGEARAAQELQRQLETADLLRLTRWPSAEYAFAAPRWSSAASRSVSITADAVHLACHTGFVQNHLAQHQGVLIRSSIPFRDIDRALVYDNGKVAIRMADRSIAWLIPDSPELALRCADLFMSFKAWATRPEATDPDATDPRAEGEDPAPTRTRTPQPTTVEASAPR